jgi:hypothetical protein
LLEAGRDSNFESLVLHPDMFRDHRTSSYRAALLELLKHAEDFKRIESSVLCGAEA